MDRIVSFSRGTIGQSVYENVRMDEDTVRETHRFIDCFDFLKNMSIDQLKLSYETDIEPIPMIYYADDDEYFVSENGNHRTLTAMLIGANYIKARVTVKHCNYEKRKKYEYIDAFRKKYSIHLLEYVNRSYSIVFFDNDGLYEIPRYPYLQDEDAFSLVDRLSGVIEEDLVKVKRINKYPSIIKRSILFYLDRKNTRLFYYIKRNYLRNKGISNLFFRKDKLRELYS